MTQAVKSSVLPLLTLVLVLVLLVVHAAEAKSLGGRVSSDAGQQRAQPDVLLLFGLLGDQAPAIDSSVLFVVGDHQQQSQQPAADPNLVLMLENFQPGGRSGAPRPARDMSTDEGAEGMDASQDVYSRTPSKFLSPPPPAASAARTAKNANKVTGRSISSAHITNQPVEEEEERGPDFLSSLVTIPQVWMSEVSHLIIQPLRKPNPGERDSYEYFGMVAKAPFISCPLGFKKSSLGTCRPVFRSRRNYPASEAHAADQETATESEPTTVNTIVTE